ncbi:MAG: AMP-binding protein [Gammaproteobacteria bacterium]
MTSKKQQNITQSALDWMISKGDDVMFILGKSVLSYATAYKQYKKINRIFEGLKNNDLAFVDIQPNTMGFCLLLTALHIQSKVILGHHYLTPAQKKTFYLLPDVTQIIQSINEELIIEPLLKDPKYCTVEEPFIGVLTSGTTATPKCVKHNLATLRHHLAQKKHFNKTWFCSYPLTHYAGLQVLFKVLFSQGRIIASAPNNMQNDLNNMLQFQCNYINCTPSYMKKLLSIGDVNQLSQLPLEVITLGGEAADKGLLDKLTTLFPATQIHQIYASTELGPVFVIKDKKEGFPAAWIDSKQAKLTDEGELMVKKRQSSLLGYKGGKNNAGTWLMTGDLIKIENERAFLIGRIDEVVNVGGYKINPFDVEKIIATIPGVVEVLVRGVKNPVIGNLVEALVKLDEHVSQVDIKLEINRTCRAFLSEYAGPHLVHFVDEIPINFVHKKRRMNQGAL